MFRNVNNDDLSVVYHPTTQNDSIVPAHDPVEINVFNNIFDFINTYSGDLEASWELSLRPKQERSSTFNGKHTLKIPANSNTLLKSSLRKNTLGHVEIENLTLANQGDKGVSWRINNKVIDFEIFNKFISYSNKHGQLVNDIFNIGLRIGDGKFMIPMWPPIPIFIAKLLGFGDQLPQNIPIPAELQKFFDWWAGDNSTPGLPTPDPGLGPIDPIEQPANPVTENVLRWTYLLDGLTTTLKVKPKNAADPQTLNANVRLEFTKTQSQTFAKLLNLTLGADGVPGFQDDERGIERSEFSKIMTLAGDYSDELLQWLWFLHREGAIFWNPTLKQATIRNAKKLNERLFNGLKVATLGENSLDFERKTPGVTPQNVSFPNLNLSLQNIHSELYVQGEVSVDLLSGQVLKAESDKSSRLKVTLGPTEFIIAPSANNPAPWKLLTDGAEFNFESTKSQWDPQGFFSFENNERALVEFKIPGSLKLIPQDVGPAPGPGPRPTEQAIVKIITNGQTYELKDLKFSTPGKIAKDDLGLQLQFDKISGKFYTKKPVTLIGAGGAQFTIPKGELTLGDLNFSALTKSPTEKQYILKPNQPNEANVTLDGDDAKVVVSNLTFNVTTLQQPDAINFNNLVLNLNILGKSQGNFTLTDLATAIKHVSLSNDGKKLAINGLHVKSHVLSSLASVPAIHKQLQNSWSRFVTAAFLEEQKQVEAALQTPALQRQQQGILLKKQELLRELLTPLATFVTPVTKMTLSAGFNSGMMEMMANHLALEFADDGSFSIVGNHLDSKSHFDNFNVRFGGTPLEPMKFEKFLEHTQQALKIYLEQEHPDIGPPAQKEYIREQCEKATAMNNVIDQLMALVSRFYSVDHK